MGLQAFVNGNFERGIGSVGDDYFFPVGVSRQQMAIFNFANLTGGSLLVSHASGNPGGNGLPLTDDDGTEVVSQYETGYWSALAKKLTCIDRL